MTNTLGNYSIQLDTNTTILSINVASRKKSQYVKGMKIPPLYTKHMVDT